MLDFKMYYLNVILWIMKKKTIWLLLLCKMTPNNKYNFREYISAAYHNVD